MRTKKAIKSNTIGTSLDSKPQPLPGPETGGEEKALPNRISFFVTDQGLPEWDRVSPKTKSQLELILRDKSVQHELGISPEVANAIIDAEFGDDEANGILDFISMGTKLGGQFVFKAPPDICQQAFTFTPDQRKKLSPSMIRLMNKWGPAILKTWKDEIGFSLLMLSALNVQVQTMHILVEKRKKESSGPRAVPKIPKEEVAKPVEKAETIIIDGNASQNLA